jgi:hypothetical protein
MHAVSHGTIYVINSPSGQDRVEGTINKRSPMGAIAALAGMLLFEDKSIYITGMQVSGLVAWAWEPLPDLCLLISHTST